MIGAPGADHGCLPFRAGSPQAFIAKCKMIDHWDRAHLAHMRAGRPRSQDADGSRFLHLAIDNQKGMLWN